MGMFGSTNIPCVGASIGIERVFAILEEKIKKENVVLRENLSDFIVCTIPSKTMDLNLEKFKLYDELWAAGLRADVNYKLNWNLGKQLTYANDQRIPFAIVIGEDEVKNGVVKVKNLNEKTEETVKRDEVIELLKKKWII